MEDREHGLGPGWEGFKRARRKRQRAIEAGLEVEIQVSLGYVPGNSRPVCFTRSEELMCEIVN